jgi:hypothetical protein
MCDASDCAVGAVLGLSKDKKHYAISYASKTLTGPGHQGHCLYRSCYSQVSLDEERCKTMPDLMDTSTPRI